MISVRIKIPDGVEQDKEQEALIQIMWILFPVLL
jgi:hypothetical protein